MFINYTKYLLAATLIILYLFLPVQNYVHAGIIDAGRLGLQISKGITDKVPCKDCPSDEKSSDCCDTTTCNCSCHAPLVQHAWFAYSPVVMVLLQLEPYWSLPQVYFPIFVPPQRFV